MFYIEKALRLDAADLWGVTQLRIDMCALKTIQILSKNVQKWFKIVAKIIQNRGLEEAWAALGA